MVQFSVATFQDHGLTGQMLSEAVQCDFIKLLGDRTLEITRRDEYDFTIQLRGVFDAIAPSGDPKRERFPLRRVAARVQLRDTRLPVEVEIQKMPENARRLAIVKGLSSETDLHPATTVAEVELRPTQGGQVYKADLSWKATEKDRDGSPYRGLVLEIIETEAFPTWDEAQNNNDVGGHLLIQNRVCEEWVKVYYAVKI